jgi:hypothetical protein
MWRKCPMLFIEVFVLSVLQLAVAFKVVEPRLIPTGGLNSSYYYCGGF